MDGKVHFAHVDASLLASHGAPVASEVPSHDAPRCWKLRPGVRGGARAGGHRWRGAGCSENGSSFAFARQHWGAGGGGGLI